MFFGDSAGVVGGETFFVTKINQVSDIGNPYDMCVLGFLVVSKKYEPIVPSQLDLRAHLI